MKDATLQSTLKAALKADAGPLPAFDEKLLLLSLPMRERLQGAGGIEPNIIEPNIASPRILAEQWSSKRRDLKIFWLAPAALAACVALAYFGNRPAVPADGLSASIAAVTEAAQSTTQFAVRPMRPFDQNLTALNHDTQRLARFVTDQLNVLPTPG